MSGAMGHVALVGCGFTGTSAFHQLVNRHPVREITLFEASGRFGPGYPYQPDECADYLINNTTDTMCLAPDNRRAFLDWLETRPDLGADLAAKGHLPRALYGTFLEDAFEKARNLAAARGIETTLIGAEATRLDEGADGRVTIGWAGGETVVDAAILTTGRCPDAPVASPPPPGAAATCIDNHIRNDALDGLPADAAVHILGASLSAYDVINRLFSEATGCRFERSAAGDLVYMPGPNQRGVVLCSRSGRLKKMQSRAPQALKRSAFTLDALMADHEPGRLTLAAVVEAVLADARDHEALLDLDAMAAPYRGCEDAEAVNARAGDLLARDIRAARDGDGANFLVDLLTDAQVEIWDGFAARLLSPDEEVRYRREHETAALAYAAACPIPTAERLLALHRAGRLRVLRGVGAPALAADGSHYRLVHAHGVERAEILVDATGKVDRDVESPRQPALVRHMAASGTLRRYVRDGRPMAGAEVDMATLRLPGTRNVYLANMLLWGPGFFTSSAFMMATIVSRILDTLFFARDGALDHVA